MRHLAELFFLASCALLVTTISFAVAWVRARERAIRAESILAGMQHPGISPASSYGHALDAIATEVERIGEGQRFLTRVMTEQNTPRIPTRTPGSITPH